MKVLHVIDSLGVGGGAEHSLRAMLPLLSERGVHSSVVTLIPRVGGLQQELAQLGFDVEVLESSSWPGRVRSLRRVVAAQAPDLVHATLLTSCLVARAAGAGSSVPLVNSLVTTSYDPIRTRAMSVAPWKLRVMRAVDGVTARHLVTRFHAVTGTVRDEAVRVLGVPPDRVVVVPRGRSRRSLGEADPERRRRARAALGVGSEALVVLNVGRQDLAKAQADLVLAFPQVVAAHPGAILVIAGREGDASGDIAAALRSTGLAGSVQLLGHRTDVGDLVVAADVFAFPSLYEGAAGAVLEAMALGTPVVGSDAPAIAEVLRGGSSGVVVPRHDPQALGAALVELLGDPERRRRLATTAAAEFDRCYELGSVVDRMVDLYRDVLDRS